MKHLILFSLVALLAACNGNKNDFDATGAFESTEVMVSSETNGKIMELNIEEGDSVIFYLDEKKNIKISNRKDCKVTPDNDKEQVVVKRGNK